MHLITITRTTLCRTPLDQGSACRRDLYLNTKHSQQTNIYLPVGIEIAITATARPLGPATNSVFKCNSCSNASFKVLEFFYNQCVKEQPWNILAEQRLQMQHQGSCRDVTTSTTPIFQTPNKKHFPGHDPWLLTSTSHLHNLWHISLY